MGAQPFDQFVELEGLGDVIVGAGIEPAGAFGGLVPVAEEQDRFGAAVAPHRAAHFEIVGVRANSCRTARRKD